MNHTPFSSLSRGDILFGIVIFLIAAGLFLPAAGYEFINLDDNVYIQENPMVVGGLNAEAVGQAFTTVHEGWWLPLLWISFMLDISIFGAGPWGHHLMNIVLHALTAGLLFAALCRMTGTRWRSFFVALLFACHPLRVESVVWIAERKDVLSGLFFMLALWTYAGQGRCSSVWRMAGVFLWMLLGLFSKAILVILPPLLLLLDYWPLRRAGDPWGAGAWKQWRPLLLEKAPLFLLALIFVCLNLYTHRMDVGAVAGLGWGGRLYLIPPNYLVYLQQILWPMNLAVFYPEQDVVSLFRAIVGGAALLACTGIAFRFRRKAPYVWVGWLWFGVALLPVIRGIRLGLAVHADRFVYLPSIGLGLALVWGGAAWADRFRCRRSVAAAGVVLCLILSLLTLRQTRVWQNSGTLFSHALQVSPHHPAALMNLGAWHFEQGRFNEAEKGFASVLEQIPDLPDAIGNLGYLQVLRGRFPEAREVLAPALHDPDAHWLTPAAWGMMLLAEGKPDRASSYLRQALKINPSAVGVRIELLRACMESGDVAGQVEQNEMLMAQIGRVFTHPRTMTPHYLEMWQWGGCGYAWTFLSNVLPGGRQRVAFLNNLAWMTAIEEGLSSETYAQALRFAEDALEQGGEERADLWDTLAAIRARTGEYAGAVEAAQKALTLAELQGNPEKIEIIKTRLQVYREECPWSE